jgi:hypothetical protein
VAGGIPRPAIKTILMRSCEASHLFEIALVLVCLDHVASVIVNANHVSGLGDWEHTTFTYTQIHRVPDCVIFAADA